MHDPAKSEAYAYDSVYRLIDYKVGSLVGSTVPLPTTQTQYNLDKVGNWDQFTQDNDGAGPGVPIVYQNTPNQMNEYDDLSTNGPGEIPDDLGIPYNFKDLTGTPTPDGENWAHDKNGNRREDGKRTYLYDDENRLVRVTRKADSVTSEYRYDALSRRVSKTVGVGMSPVTTRYAYDDARIVEEQNSAVVTLATYVYGNYIDEVLNMQRGGADYYYHQNALWSVIAVTDANATVVERYAYTDYGCPSVIHSAIGNPWMFTGRQWDEESGVYFYRARYYDCEGGRFLQRDPFGYVDGISLYRAYFVANGTDPSGTISVVDAIISALTNGICYKYDVTAVNFAGANYNEVGRGLRRCTGVSLDAVLSGMKNEVKPPYKGEKRCDKDCECKKLIEITNPTIGPLPFTIFIVGWMDHSFDPTSNWRCKVSFDLSISIVGSGYAGVCVKT